MSKKLTHEEFMQRVFDVNEHVRNGEIEIIGKYNGLENEIEYICHKCGAVRSPTAASLLLGNGCAICGKKQSGKTQRKTNEEFVRQLRKINDKITPLTQYIMRNQCMDFMCQYGHIWAARPQEVLHGSGCPYCAGKKVLIGFNDIATTSPEIFAVLANKEDGYKFTGCSNKRVDFKCPECGHVQNRKISSVAHRGFNCERCGSGISYPNRLGRAFFDQIPGLVYRTEYRSLWTKQYVYDFYFTFENIEYVVEFDGRQHFFDAPFFDMSLAEQQAIDAIKNKLAKDNNVRIIRIDCAESNAEYIKNNICLSELSSLFDLSQIDWMLCDEKAQKNLVKIVCDAWEAGVHSFKQLATEFHIGEGTVRDYINRGKRLGWCEYAPINERPLYNYPVSVASILDGETYYFDSVKQCSARLEDVCGICASPPTIKKYCRSGQPYNGVIFQYTNITIQN